MAWWSKKPESESESVEYSQQDYAGQRQGVNDRGVPYLDQKLEQTISPETIAVMQSLGFSLDDIKKMSQAQ